MDFLDLSAGTDGSRKSGRRYDPNKRLRTIIRTILATADHMSTLITVLFALISAIPFLIAIKRKHANITLLAVLDFFFSWTIIGWIIVLAWAIWGRSDPKEYAKQSSVM